MPKITFNDSSGAGRTIEAELGSTVMETAIRNNIPGIEAECGGACACATCHVYVEETWKEKTGDPSPMEEDMLDFAFDVRPTSRLSCQIKVTEDLDGLVVTVPPRQACRLTRCARVATRGTAAGSPSSQCPKSPTSNTTARPTRSTPRWARP